MTMERTLSVPERIALDAHASPRKVFWVTWLGWMLDSFDMGIFMFILVPAMTELLSQSGKPITASTLALHGGYAFSIFMLGWACSMFWGWLADRIGRVKVMCLTILVYSIFTAACGLAAGLTSFMIFRFMAGFGIGGEWAAGTPLLQESVPENMRVRLAGWLHSATPIGFLLGSCCSLLLPYIGWRGMFFIGIFPAFLTIFVRLNFKEPTKWTAANAQSQARVKDLFTGALARPTWSAALMMSCIIVGVWSSTFWAPTLVIAQLTSHGMPAADAQKIASMSGIITNIGTLMGCMAMPYIVETIGSRRATAMIFFIASFLLNVVAYAGVIMHLGNITLFICLLPLMGLLTNGVYALYSIWLPELFPTKFRCLGSGFAFSFGRVLGAAGPTIVGSLVAYTGSLPTAIVTVSIIYILGLPAILWAPETARIPLPE